MGEPPPDHRACLYSQSQRPKLKVFKLVQAYQGSQGQSAVSTIARHDGSVRWVSLNSRNFQHRALADNNLELVARIQILFWGASGQRGTFGARESARISADLSAL